MRYPRARLVLHALTHFMVDFACFFALFAQSADPSEKAWLILCYNALAFGLEVPFGALADRLGDVRPATILGVGLVAWGALFYGMPWASLVLLGVGNALFHVGGAVASMRHCPGNALYAGVYVAPGVLGIALGAAAGTKGSMSPTFIAFLLLILILGIWAVGPGALRARPRPDAEHPPLLKLGMAAVALCLLSIAIRSFVGYGASLPTGAALAAACFIFLGKLLGGALARRVPWHVLGFLGVGLGGLMMALLPASGIVRLGLLLFNLAMPLTLAAVMGAMPHMPGFGFGLTTFALVFGASPLYFLPADYAAPPWLVAALSIASALMLLIALKKRRDGGSALEHNASVQPAKHEDPAPAPASEPLPDAESGAEAACVECLTGTDDPDASNHDQGIAPEIRNREE